MKKLYIKTYGCQMNFYDSEKMANMLENVGFSITENSAEANLILLNTCHIRDKAVEKTYSDLGRIKKTFKSNNPQNEKPIIVVAGCVAQAQGKEIMNRSPWVDIVVGPQSYANLPKLIDQVNKIDKKKSINIDFPIIPKFDLLDHELNKKNVSPYITIQEGCDKFCSFCVVPYTRGSEYSRSVNSIIDELEKLIEKGAKQITLLGQNVNAWSGPSYGGSMWSFGQLLEKISSFDEIKSIRYTTSHPLDMDIHLLEAHKNLNKLMPYLHLPVQSGSDRILKMMNRKHNVNEYIEIIDKIRSYKPDIAISSDFIVGFPGETKNDHKETLDLINKIKFSSSFSFKFSPRPGTPAFELNDSVKEEEKKERLQELQSLLKFHQLEFNKKFVGSKMNILLTNKNKNNLYYGRSEYNQAVVMSDNKNTFETECNLIDEFIEAKISNAFQNSLEADLSSIKI